ncbi:MAG: hypothetical protein U0Y68_11575 [Blastocatellia bacterium]
MSYTLSFTTLHPYDAGKPGIDLAVVLRANQRRTGFIAKLDTGASHCIFERSYGEDLLLDVEAGYELKISTATGTFIVYGHDVTLSVGEFDFDVVVYFAKEATFTRNVLGRNGFLALVRLGLIDYDGRLFLSRYDT